MGQSVILAAYNLDDRWSVPCSIIELTPMIGGNDVEGEPFNPSDANRQQKDLLANRDGRELTEYSGESSTALAFSCG